MRFAQNCISSEWQGRDQKWTCPLMGPKHPMITLPATLKVLV